MKIKNIKERLREYFFVNPTAKKRVRQLERELKLPLPSVIRYCKELEKEEILTRVEISGVTFYTANRTSKTFLLEKRLFNLKSIFESGIIYYCIKEYSNPVIVLFGSYSRGEDTEESDIDLYIQTPSKTEITLKQFEPILKRKIQVFSYQAIRHISNKHLANNIINGIVLNNFMEVV